VAAVPEVVPEDLAVVLADLAVALADLAVVPEVALADLAEDLLAVPEVVLADLLVVPEVALVDLAEDLLVVLVDLAEDLLVVLVDLAEDLPVVLLVAQSLLAVDLPVLVLLPMVRAETQRRDLVMLFPNNLVKVVREARVKPEVKEDLEEVELALETPVSSLRQRGQVE